MNIRPLHDRVIIKREEVETRSAGGYRPVHFLQGHGFVGFQGGRFDDLPCAAVLHRRNGGEEQGHFEFIHLFTCFFGADY